MRSIQKPAPGLPAGLTWLLVVAVLGYAGWESVTRAQHLLALTHSEGEAIAAARVDASSTTGYAEGRRALVLPRGSTDTAHWIMQTQMMRPEGPWRIRAVGYDNAPVGREVHWASPYRWWLAALAWADHVVTGRPWGIAVERAALTAGPALFISALLALALLLYRQFTPGAAVVAVVGAVAVAPFYVDFLPGRADHHGLANLCALGTVLFFVMGAGAGPRARPGDPVVRSLSAQAWLDLSALSGGIGLWISAATQVPVLVGLGTGVLASALVSRKAEDASGALLEPSALRRWGLMGAGVSLLAYLIEYAPNVAQLRLEVNHPWHALAWAGAGELLRVLTRAVSGKRIHVPREDRWLAGLAVAAVAVLPLTVVLAPAAFTVSDPLLWRIHSLHLAEFQSLTRHLFTPDFNWRRLELALPMFLLVPVLLQLGAGLRPRRVNAWLALALMPPLLGWAMGWNQVRWVGLAFVLTIPVVAAFLATCDGRRRAVGVAACLGALAPGFFMTIVRARASADVTVEEIQNLVERDVAHWLQRRHLVPPAVVAAAPGVTTKLIFFGGLKGIGTFYWENARGLERLAAFYGAESTEAAHGLARETGLTHVVFVSWSPTELELAKLHRGIVDPTAAAPEDAFIRRLLSGAVPPSWLRAVAFPLPDHPALQGAQVRIWTVTPPMSLPEALVRAIAFQLDTREIGRAQQLLPLLDRFPEYLPAAVMRAAVAGRVRDEAAFGAALREVRSRLSEAEALVLEDHLHLVVVLTVAQQLNAAQEQLRAAMRKVTAPALQQLPAGTLADLFALASALNVPWPDPHLQRVGEELLPPARP